MNRRLARFVLGSALSLILTAGSTAVIGPEIGGRAQDNAAIIDGILTGSAHDATTPAATVADPGVVFLRSGLCPNRAVGVWDASVCPVGVAAVLTASCALGQVALAPLWMRSRDPGAVSGWTVWVLVAGSGGCPGEVGFPALSAADFQRLPLVASVIGVEPPAGWALANVPVFVHTDAQAQVLRTSVLGVGVSVRAVPVGFTWNFDDASIPVSTTDPGRAYPHGTVSHTYVGAGVHRIALDTLWSGQFLVDGFTTWLPITGTAVTHTTSPALTVHTARAHLVATGT